jgi:hypothetical protein
MFALKFYDGCDNRKATRSWNVIENETEVMRRDHEAALRFVMIFDDLEEKISQARVKISARLYGSEL